METSSSELTTHALSLLPFAARLRVFMAEFAARYGLPSECNIVRKAGYVASMNYQTKTPNWVLQVLISTT